MSGRWRGFEKHRRIFHAMTEFFLAITAAAIGLPVLVVSRGPAPAGVTWTWLAFKARTSKLESR